MAFASPRRWVMSVEPTMSVNRIVRNGVSACASPTGWAGGAEKAHHRVALDLDDLGGRQAVRLSVHRLGRRLVRRVDEAEHALGVAVVPVAQVVHAVLGLHRHVHRVGAGELFGRDGRRCRGDPCTSARRSPLVADEYGPGYLRRFIDDLDEYRAANLRNWESRVPVHAGSRDYDLAGLAADPHPAEPGRRLRPTVARRSHRPRRRAPPVPHRHRHDLAGAPRRPRHGRRLLARARWPSPAISPRQPAWTCASWSRSSTPCPRCSAPSSTSCTPGVGALNWLPDIAGWAGWWRRCSARAGASTYATATRC